MTILRPRRCLWVVLDGEDGFVVDSDAFEGAIKQGRVGFDDVFWQGVSVDDEAVVLAGDFDCAGGQVLDRVVGAAVAHVHFFGFGAQSKRQQLMAEADAEHR